MTIQSKKISRAINGLRKIIDVAISVMFMLMWIIVLLNIVMRWVFNNPIAWAGELARYSFISIIFLGAILAMKDGAHIGMDFIIERFPESVHSKIVLFNDLLALVFLILFTYGSIRVMFNNTEVMSSAMGIPMSIPYAALPIGGIGMILELTMKILRIESKDEHKMEVPL